MAEISHSSSSCGSGGVVDEASAAFELVKSAETGKFVIGRFERFEVVRSQAQADGTTRVQRHQRVRPDLKACPDGLAVQETVSLDGVPAMILGHAPVVKLPTGKRPLGSEVYEGQQQPMESRFLILRRTKGPDGKPAFHVSVADDWYTFSKATMLSEEDRSMDLEEVERRFELHRRSSNRRSRLAGTLAKMAARKGTELASVNDGDPDAAIRDAELTGAAGSMRTMMEVASEEASKTVHMGRLLVQERFTRVQQDDDERLDDSYRASFQREQDEREGKTRRRLGYSGIHGADRAVNHEDRETMDEDDAEVLGDFDAARQAEEAIFTQFDDDEDAGIEAAVMQLEEGTGLGDEAGAETLRAVTERSGMDGDQDEIADEKEEDRDDDNDEDDDEDDEDDEDEAVDGSKGSIFGKANMAIARQRRMRQQQAAEAVAARAKRDATAEAGAAASNSSAAAAAAAGTSDTRKRPRGGEADAQVAVLEEGETAGGGGAGKKSKAGVAAKIEKNSRRFFVEHGGRVTAKAIGKFVDKLIKRYGEAARRLGLEVIGRLASRRGGIGPDAIWELRAAEWKNVSS